MKLNKWHLVLAVGAAAIKFTSRVSIPKGATAVSPFDQKRYLGKWYEIARLDFKYERNLDNVTARYSLNDDGSIQVDNRGHDYVKKERKKSMGKAKFVGSPNEGRLKVSFFWPFYSGYNVIALDDNYQYALIAGNNLNYLWILSRVTSIPEKVKADYLLKAQSLGYDTSALIWVKHDKAAAGNSS